MELFIPVRWRSSGWRTRRSGDSLRGAKLSGRSSPVATQVFALAPSFAVNTSGGLNALIVAAESQPVMGSAQEPGACTEARVV